MEWYYQQTTIQKYRTQQTLGMLEIRLTNILLGHFSGNINIFLFQGHSPCLIKNALLKRIWKWRSASTFCPILQLLCNLVAPVCRLMFNPVVSVPVCRMASEPVLQCFWACRTLWRSYCSNPKREIYMKPPVDDECSCQFLWRKSTYFLSYNVIKNPKNV